MIGRITGKSMFPAAFLSLLTPVVASAQPAPSVQVHAMFRTDALSIRPAFNDLAGADWAASAIRVLAAEGVVHGTSAEKFDPASPVTRADFAVSVTRLFGLRTGPRTFAFSDVPTDHLSYEGVEAAAPFMGFAPQQRAAFRPSDPEIVQDAVATIMRILAARQALAVARAAESEALLAKTPDAASTDPALRPYIATAYRAGFLAHLPTPIRPSAPLTRAEAAVLLQEVQYTFHPLVLDCPAQSRKPASVLKLTTTVAAAPSLADICTTRAGFAKGSVVNLQRGTIDQLSALLDTRVPSTSGSALLNQGPPTDLQIKKDGKYRPPRLRPDQGTVIARGPLALSLLGAHRKPGGVPHYFLGLVPSGRTAQTLAARGLDKWTQHEIADPPPLAGACPIAFGAPANTSLGNSWTCYGEVSVQAVSSTCDWPSINSCTPSGTFVLSADVLRQNENDATGDRYLIIAQWDTNLGSSPCDWNNVFIDSKTCGPYMTDRTISMPLVTLDTNPPSFPFSAPPGGSTGTVTLIPGPAGHQPGTNVCSHGAGISDTIGVGISIGGSAGGASGSMSMTTSQGFSQSWTCPDIVITDHTNDPSGSPNYPVNTPSWVENFDPPVYSYSTGSGPGQDALSNFQGTTEAAVFQIPENSGPTISPCSDSRMIRSST